jgi:hypothetical protein
MAQKLNLAIEPTEKQRAEGVRHSPFRAAPVANLASDPALARVPVEPPARLQ